MHKAVPPPQLAILERSLITHRVVIYTLKAVTTGIQIFCHLHLVVRVILACVGLEQNVPTRKAIHPTHPTACVAQWFTYAMSVIATMKIAKIVLQLIIDKGFVILGETYNQHVPADVQRRVNILNERKLTKTLSMIRFNNSSDDDEENGNAGGRRTATRTTGGDDGMNGVELTVPVHAINRKNPLEQHTELVLIAELKEQNQQQAEQNQQQAEQICVLQEQVAKLMKVAVAATKSKKATL